VVPAGSFTMGSPASESERGNDEGPQHQVRIGKAFAIGKFEVTVGEFRRFVQAAGYSAGGSCWVDPGGTEDWKDTPGYGWDNPAFSGYRQSDRDPVVCVNWNDAQAYISWLFQQTGKQYRLLTEAEWEYAARAGTTSAYPWGSSSDAGCGDANGADQSAKRRYPGWPTLSCDDGQVFTAAVGSYRANRFGLYDMIGNVWEWTEDCYQSYSGAPSDGSAVGGSCEWRVLRGGSWGSNQALRSAFRDLGPPVHRGDVSGFRLARTL